MPRKCQCCESEHLMEISQAIRDGETHAAIACRYGVSPDSVQRHARTHMGKSAGKGSNSHNAIDLLRSIIQQTGEIASTCANQGDARGSIEAIAKQLSALESLLRLEQEHKEQREKPLPVWTDSGELNPNALQRDMTIADFDEIIRREVELNREKPESASGQSSVQPQ